LLKGEMEGDPNAGTKQEELHLEMVKYSYKIVGEVFEKCDDASLREDCINNGTLERFIERIGQLTGEKPRKRVHQSPQKEETKSLKFNQGSTSKKGVDSENKKRKGVGYTSGVGQVWNVSEYLKSKEARSSQIANIVNILKYIIKGKDWEAPEVVKQLFLESSLLPILEAAFRNGSLLEMAKENDLYISYLEFVQKIAQQETLIDILMDIGDEYEPRQRDPIYKLLESLSSLASIFLSALTSDKQETEDTLKPRELATKIIETQKLTSEAVKEHDKNKQQQSLAELLSMPLDIAYKRLMQGQRFEYMSIKDTSGMYSHYYNAELSKNANPPQTKLVRLAQEIADLSNSLPCDHTNAIYCRVDKERVDVMKVIIMGASGTPYAHGAFVYDLFFDNQYPNSPPKCTLITTGGQAVRFNPNLYHNGKVCLSLLGTWRGSATENWDPKLSTILQVLLSIQAIIMSNEVYFNEPGYEHEAGTVDGEKKNDAYANIVKYCNVKYAIIDQIKNPAKGFEKVIRGNFYLKKNEVLKEIGEWVKQAKTT